MDDSHDHHSGSSSVTGSLPTLAARIVISALRAAGKDKLAKGIETLPEKIGQLIGAPFKKVEDKIAKGVEITEQDEQALADHLAKKPEDAATVLGLTLGCIVDSVNDAESQRKANLGGYALVLDIICGAMAKAGTSLALRGFLHDATCISYWHNKGRGKPNFLHLSDSLSPDALEIYFLEEEPTVENLAALNEIIRRDSDRHLPASVYDYEHDKSVAKLLKVFETSIITSQLHPNPSELDTGRPDPFELAADPTRPMEFVSQIPPRSPNLIPMFESLFEAMRAQNTVNISPEQLKTQLLDSLKKTS